MLFKAMKDPEISDEEKKDKEKAYNLYKERYWENVDLSHEGFVRTPIFLNKLNTYFDRVLIQEADTIIQAIDHLIVSANSD